MIADRDSLLRSRAAAEAVARDWLASRDHQALVAEFAGVAAIDDQIAIAERLLAEIGWATALFTPLFAALSADPWFEPPFRVARDPIRIGAVLFECPEATLTATVMSADAMAGQAPPRTIALSGRVAVTRYVRGGHARLLRWEAGPATGDLAIGTAAPARPIVPLALRDGLVARLDGRVRGHLLEGATADVVTLSFALRGDRAGYVREYDRASGTLLRAATIEERDSRTQMLLTLLRLMRRRDARDCFDAASRAPAFHLRWAAMREWLALDAGAALPRLEVMAVDDPNAEVRTAARSTLDMVTARRAA